MPIPGPRTQTGPLPGYNNPGLESPDRFNHWERPGSVSWAGRTPGLMVASLRGAVLAAGQVRRMWKQSVDLIPAQAAFSWAENAPAPGRPIVSPGPFEITRALRYMTRSLYVAGGTDNSRFVGLHTVVPKWNRGKQVTVNSGTARNRPTVRNRISSFGSRVPTLNQPVPAAQDQSNG